MMQNINLLPCLILACITCSTVLYRRGSSALNGAPYATVKDCGSGCQIAATYNTHAFKLAENS